MKSNVLTSTKKLTGKKPVRKGWTTLSDASRIKLSEIKRIIIHIPNTGKPKQVNVNWE